MFPREELIHCQIWNQLSDYNYDKQDNLPSGVIRVGTQDIAEFFRKIKNNGNKYIVITSCCDYSIRYQQYNPIYRDYAKGIEMFGTDELGYKPVSMKPRCFLEKCNIKDKYIVKTYSHTDSTFPEIPDNVLVWFCTNSFIDDSRVVNIPFGINNYDLMGECLDVFSKLNIVDWKNKERKVYACFQYYTNERALIHQILKIQQQSLPDLLQIEKGVDFNTFLKGLSNNRYVFCPAGNGLDTFRIWETYYAGSIPIIEESMSWVLKHGLPAYVIGNTLQFHPHLVYAIDYINENNNNDISKLKALKFSYWKELVNNAKLLL